ncbi:hypothetical protein SUGI_0504170 [Cryptomeria japonica]|nr:hypothetical protein SUGI_0504170 [Cryptomeria japonica]
MVNVRDNSANLLLPTSWCTWVAENSHVIHDVNGVIKSNLKVSEGNQSNNLALCMLYTTPIDIIFVLFKIRAIPFMNLNETN